MGILLNIGGALRVCTRQGTKCVISPEHGFRVGVDDGGAQAILQSHGEESRVDVFPLGQAKGHIGNAQRSVYPQLIPQQTQGFQCHGGSLPAGADGHGQCVHDNVVLGDAIGGGGVHNLFGNLKAPLCRFRNAVFIQGQGDHRAAVFLHQREYGFHALFFAVHRVDEGFSVIDSQGGLHHFRAGSIDLQRQIGNPLQLGNGLAHQGFFVDFRQAHVHVQHMGAALLLGYAFPEDVFHVVFPQRLLKALFAGRVNALANNHGFFAEYHCLCIGGNHGTLFLRQRNQRKLSAALYGFPKMFRRGAAAAANDPRAALDDFFHQLCELVGVYVKHGLTVFPAGKAGVGVDDHGQRGTFCQLRQQRKHLLGAKAAVKAQRIHAQAFQHGHRSRNIAAGEELSAFVKNHGDENRQGSVLFCAQNGGLHLHGIAHGFNQNQIGTGFFTHGGSFAKGRNGFLKVQIAHRLHELSGGADVHGNHGRMTALGNGLFGMRNTGGNDGFQLFTGEFKAVRAESVGFNNLASGGEIIRVNRCNQIGVGEVPGFGKLPGLEAVLL